MGDLELVCPGDEERTVRRDGSVKKNGKAVEAECEKAAGYKKLNRGEEDVRRMWKKTEKMIWNRSSESTRCGGGSDVKVWCKGVALVEDDSVCERTFKACQSAEIVGLSLVQSHIFSNGSDSTCNIHVYMYMRCMSLRIVTQMSVKVPKF